mgnify:CR=1 FL=1
MRNRIITIIAGYMFCSAAFAQSNDFKQVFNACVKAQSSMSGGEGSKSEINEASELLGKAQWSTLILQRVSTKGEADIKGHMVFTPAFLAECAKGRTVFLKAKEYAEEERSEDRGGNTQLCTKCIAGKSTVKYGLRWSDRTLHVGAVAEVNGKLNVYVEVKDPKGHMSGPYKVSSNEFKGDGKRLLDPIKMPGGMCEVYITIENKHRKAKSVAIIVE